MSNIYIQEPPTNGKVLLKTTVGEIDIELWSKEAPKACRNFIQLCLEGYYDGLIFHRVVKGFIAQTGDPTGTGMGGESIYGEPFKDEFHSRLKFNRRGLVGMANAGKDDNTSQFFFTFGPTPELQNKHTIFGKVSGKTIYNMIKLEESIVDRNDRPKHPQKILRTEILSNPFDDILPRVTRGKKKDKETSEKRPEVKGTKDLKLLSFADEEAEDDEDEVIDLKGKSKSSHDLLKNDPKLSSVPVVHPSELRKPSEKKSRNDSDDESSSSRKKKKRNKHHSDDEDKDTQEKDSRHETTSKLPEDLDDDPEDEYIDEKTRAEQKKIEEARNEYKKLKKEMASDRKKKHESVIPESKPKDEAVAEFLQETAKYKDTSSKILKKGSKREEEALALLAKFKSKLKTSTVVRKDEPKETSEVTEESIAGENSTGGGGSSSGADISWLSHKLSCQKEDEKPVLAKDANMRGEGDWYDIYDPRNKMNQRKAAFESSSSSKKK